MPPRKPTAPSRRRVRRPEPLPDEQVEVVDHKDRPLAVLGLSDVHRQVLRHRSVLVLIYDPNGKVYLQRRKENKSLYPGRWDVSASGHVRAGESREDAARRELHEELGLFAGRLLERGRVPASAQTGFEFVTLYSAGKTREEPRPNPDELDGGYFFDHSEVACLVQRFRELCTPGLVHFYEQGLIFPHAG